MQDSIDADYTTEAIIKIEDAFLNDNPEKLENLKNVIGLVILKEIKIEDILRMTKNVLSISDEAAKEATLIILLEILFPIKDYFPGIENEILKFGEQVPRETLRTLNQQLLKREEEMEKMQEVKEKKGEEVLKETIEYMPIEEMIKNYPQVELQQIGSQESITVKGFQAPMQPLIKYWMKDYLEKVGYYKHSNLERVQYVYHDKNTKDMNEEERRQLNLVLKSLDEGIELPYSRKMNKIDFGKIGEE